MNIQTFYQKLGELRKHGYTATKENDIETIIIHKPLHVFRHMCPITAVCHYEYGQLFHMCDFRKAGIRLKLHPKTVTAIVTASDCNHQAPFSYKIWSPKIRKAIEKALLLENGV